MKKIFGVIFTFISLTVSAQFTNGDFETITCPDDCNLANNSFDCIPGWFATLADNNEKPLQRTTCPGDIVCSGNYSLRLLSTSGGGISARTNNPIPPNNAPNIPLLITMQAYIENFEDDDAGIKIFGFDNNQFTELAFARPDVYETCEELIFTFLPPTQNFAELSFDVAAEMGPHASDFLRASIDDVNYCGAAFEVDNNCGVGTLTFNSCWNSADIFYTVVEIGFEDGTELVYDENVDITQPFNFPVTALGEYNIEVSFIDFDLTTNDFFFVYDVDQLNENNCCEGQIQCEARTDLTACAEEGDFGFIHLECLGQEGLSYEWDFPAGSTAFEVQTASSSTIVQASEGVYKVVVSSKECKEVLEFVISADCCEQLVNCSTPEYPYCIGRKDKIEMGWSAVAEASGYQIEILENGGPCCNFLSKPLLFTVTEPFFEYSPQTLPDCFSWRVRAICKEGYSVYTDYQCVYDGLCGRRINEDTNSKVEPLQDRPQVYPNPNNGVLNLAMTAEVELEVQVDLLDINGKLINSLPKEGFADGIYRRQWSLNDRLPEGIYLIVFHTNQGIYQERVVLTR